MATSRSPIPARTSALFTTALTAACAVLTVGVGSAHAAATVDIEFVAEHLPEVAMDNRYASLPLWSSLETSAAAPWPVADSGAGIRARLRARGLTPAVTIGYSRIGAGELTLTGPGLTLSLHRSLTDSTGLRSFAFYDRATFAGRGDLRPLRTLALDPLPLPLPAAAIFDSRGGHMNHAGLGLAFSRDRDSQRLGIHRWVTGLLAGRVSLDGAAFNYRILSGPATGTAGIVDFSGHYDQLTLFGGIELPRHRGAWTFAPHALLAVPVPRRGVLTRLTGPGFDLSGDTARAGNGRHFGDPALALGVELVFEPWGLNIDLGSTLTQATLERLVHRGTDSNLAVAVGWRF